MAGWSPHKSINESQIILNMFIEGKRTFAIQLKENSKVIGSLGLEELSIDLGEPYSSMIGREIGYVLSKNYWGMGLMPEAVKRLIDFCFKDEKYDFLQCSHSITNNQSRRVIEKSGFIFVKENQRKTCDGNVHKARYYVLKNLSK